MNNEDLSPARTPPVTEKPVVPPQQPEAPPPAPHNHHNRAILWLTAAILFIALICLLLWLLYFRFHESTDDAYVNGNMINVTTVIAGTPIAFYADDTDLVKEGQLLVRLDPTAYQIAFDKEVSILASTVLQVRQLYNRVDEYKANVGNRLTIARKALYDYRNRKELVGSKAVSDEEFIHARDDLMSAKLALKEAKAQLQVAIDAAGPTPLEKHPQIEAQKSAVRQAFYNLKHCDILAPTTGYVAQRSVEVGQWVTASTFLMAIIPTDYIWIDANFKETQLADMRIGQPASITIDLYGSRVKFHGKVLGIASGTGSVFSIIPPQNATGNWIKIVQRLPVRISVDKEQLEKYPLRLGLSADVNVDISDTSGPMLAQITSKKPIATTEVFDLDLATIDAEMDAIVKSNTK
jgi:membrane fusion protein (multidrug efflux system)